MLKKFLFVAALLLAVSAASQAADLGKIPVALTKAKVGQWASYTVMGGVQQKQTVTSIEGTGDDQVITVKLEVMMNGQVMQSQDQKVTMREAKDVAGDSPWAQAPDTKISDAKVTIKGKEYNAVLVEFTLNGSKAKFYFSDAVPVYGIVKMEAEGAPGPLMELVDFGG